MAERGRSSVQKMRVVRSVAMAGKDAMRLSVWKVERAFAARRKRVVVPMIRRRVARRMRWRREARVVAAERVEMVYSTVVGVGRLTMSMITAPRSAVNIVLFHWLVV